MGSFDCPTCKTSRHITDGEGLAADRCWECGTPVPGPVWFVYGGAQYYPSGDVIHAATPEEAVELAELPEGDPVLVFPWDAVALKRLPDA